MAALAKLYGHYRKRLSIKGVMRVVGQPYWRLRDYLQGGGASYRVSAKRGQSQRSWGWRAHSPPTGIGESIIACVNNTPGSGASEFGDGWASWVCDRLRR